MDGQELRVEGLVRLGRLTAVSPEQEALAALAAAREHRSAVAAAVRERGLLETARRRPRSAEAIFEQTAHDLPDAGFGLARARTLPGCGLARHG